MRPLVLLSGGLDSTTCLAIASREAVSLEAISIFYGQKHVTEIDAARRVAKYYAARHHEVTLDPNQFLGAGSTLMDPDKPNPETTYEELQKAVGPSPTYVPFRNGNLLSVAASYALKLKCDTIYAGMHAEDAKNWAYPDCTPEFLGAMANAIYVGTYHKVRLVAPLMWMTKTEVVACGKHLGVPFDLTWSCYNGREKACGVCPTCISRIAAFRENGMIDPISYEEVA